MNRALLMISLALLTTLPAAAQVDWDAVPLLRHDAFQAVNPDGSSAFGGGFPTRLRGIVLNDAADWLDPTADYTPDYTPWYMGGQWEIFVQAVDDPSETYDDGDAGGTACWMGQNYGNLPWIGDPWFSYFDDEWLSELERLQFPDGTGSAPLAPGDLIEVRARGGLPYAGKMNVNEQHNNDRDDGTGEIGTAHDFEIVILERGFGLPDAQPITLGDLLEQTGENEFAFVWDPTRQAGGERCQSTRVLLKGVRLVEGEEWMPDADVIVADGTGRTFTLHVGRHPSFGTLPAPAATFNVTGVMNQEATSGIGGYFLMAMRASDIVCGDANCDGALDLRDINPFVLALSNPEGYATQFPGCLPDMNGDFVVYLDDINLFVTALATGGCP